MEIVSGLLNSKISHSVNFHRVHENEKGRFLFLLGILFPLLPTRFKTFTKSPYVRRFAFQV